MNTHVELDARGDRPVGVPIAAGLMVLAAVSGVGMRLASGEFNTAAIAWLFFHAFTIVVAVGLFLQQPWAYWTTLLFIGLGMLLTVMRLLGVATQLHPAYHIVRLAIHAIWFVYFLLPSVRRSFGLGRSLAI